jgi:hypothetical protein
MAQYDLSSSLDPPAPPPQIEPDKPGSIVLAKAKSEHSVGGVEIEAGDLQVIHSYKEMVELKGLEPSKPLPCRGSALPIELQPHLLGKLLWADPRDRADIPLLPWRSFAVL